MSFLGRDPSEHSRVTYRVSQGQSGSDLGSVDVGHEGQMEGLFLEGQSVGHVPVGQGGHLTQSRVSSSGSVT